MPAAPIARRLSSTPASAPTPISATATPARPRSEAPGPLGLPRTGVVIIGTSRSATAAAAMLAASESGSPILTGWVALDASDVAPGWSLPRLGSVVDLPAIAARFGLKAAIICVPSSRGGAAAGEISQASARAGVPARVIPSIEELLQPPVAAIEGPEAPKPRPNIYSPAPVIDLGRLIGRTPHHLDRDAIARVLTGRRVLITGAGGSIGAELARVAASFGLEQLILMERAENALFEIDRQMKERHPALGRRAVLHDVTDTEGTHRLLGELRPHVVFHAAAHKHVPLMEDHPGHAITNNLFGTKSIADASVACGAERFVMISSDKAVNPTSVMGATKRMAELYVRALGPRAAEHGTRLSMVRFGNVLGSACSVLTIWSSQIAEFLAGSGTPITITDPRMTRFFMTIPEAATLVVQSLTSADAEAGGKAPVGVYVLDMGEPIRIVDLAARFVRAHGLEPRFVGLAAAEAEAQVQPAQGIACIDVACTGARPGEKLHEELAYAAEALRPTEHPGIRSWAGPGFGEADVARVQEMVAELGGLRFSTDRAALHRAIRRFVPEMRAAGGGGA